MKEIKTRIGGKKYSDREVVIREDSQAPQGYNVYYKGDRMLGTAPIGGGAGFEVPFDRIHLHPVDFAMFAKTYQRHATTPTARRALPFHDWKKKVSQ